MIDTLNNYKTWDLVEPAKLQSYVDGSATGDPLEIEITKWGALTRRELQSPLFVLSGDELGVNLPVALLEGKEPRQNDVLTRVDESNTQYIIKSDPQLLHGKSRWRCIVSKAR